MYSLPNLNKACDAGADLRPGEDNFRELRNAIKHHVSGTHITRTYPSGSHGRIEAFWNPREKRFSDPGNDIWLQYRGGRWHMSRRDFYHDAGANDLVEQGNTHIKYGRLQQMWITYWMLILRDVTLPNQQNEGVQYDIHINPFVETDWIQPEPDAELPSNEFDPLELVIAKAIGGIRSLSPADIAAAIRKAGLSKTL